MEQDFIATELLSELKRENERKDKQVKRLQLALVTVVLTSFVTLLSLVGVFVWYLNQYDFSSEYSTVQTAEGVYAVIDSEGNVIELKYKGMYSFVHTDELRNAYDTYKVIHTLAKEGFKEPPAKNVTNVYLSAAGKKG